MAPPIAVSGRVPWRLRSPPEPGGTHPVSGVAGRSSRARAPVVPSGGCLAEEEQREDCRGGALPRDLGGVDQGPDHRGADSENPCSGTVPAVDEPQQQAPDHQLELVGPVFAAGVPGERLLRHEERQGEQDEPANPQPGCQSVETLACAGTGGGGHVRAHGANGTARGAAPLVLGNPLLPA